jgi:hypothetical protein
MFDDECEENEMNEVSTICLSLAREVKYSALTETSPQEGFKIKDLKSDC